jgi:predicted PurR-regulated permease PerM
MLMSIEQETSAEQNPPTIPTEDTLQSHQAKLVERSPRVLVALLILAVVYTLAIAKSFLIPIALAFFLSLLLAPAVNWLARGRIPRTLGSALVVMLGLALLSYLFSTTIDPIGKWVENSSQNLREIERKLLPITRTIVEVSRTADEVDRLTSVAGEEQVSIRGVSFRELLYANARGLVSGTVMTALVLYFFLSWGRVMLARLARFSGESKTRRQVLEISSVLESEVSRYLVTIALINAVLGVLVALLMYVLGIPEPMLFGLAAMLLNFIPYFGALLTAVMLAATAILTFDGLYMPAVAVFCFIALTALEGQVVTPQILGNRLSLNPLVVFLAIAFWFWLWGVVGALMAVPMLITGKLVGDRVESMRPAARLLGR